MPRPDATAERTAQIMQAAMQVIAQKGFTAARMDDIAEAAGLSKGTLYKYYNNKDALIKALIKMIMEEQFEMARQFLGAEGSMIEKLTNMAVATTIGMQAMPEMQSLFYEFFSQIGRNPDLKVMAEQLGENILDTMRNLVKQGIAQGEISAETDIATAATLLVAVHEGLELLWMLTPPLIPNLKQLKVAAFTTLIAGFNQEAEG